MRHFMNRFANRLEEPFGAPTLALRSPGISVKSRSRQFPETWIGDSTSCSQAETREVEGSMSMSLLVIWN